MGHFVELLEELRGETSQNKFAARIGVDQGEVSKLLSGRRRPARRVILALLRTFPERRHQIVATLLREDTPTAAAS
jgi:transcriptional regulator with XRE-family HTH domain